MRRGFLSGEETLADPGSPKLRNVGFKGREGRSVRRALTTRIFGKEVRNGSLGSPILGEFVAKKWGGGCFSQDKRIDFRVNSEKRVPRGALKLTILGGSEREDGPQDTPNPGNWGKGENESSRPS